MRTTLDEADISSNHLGLAERALTAMILLLSTGAFMNLGVVDSAGGPVAGVRVLWYVAYLVIGALFLSKCPRKGRFLFAVAPLVPVVAFAMVSSSWSQDPALSFRHSVVLVITVLFGFYFASRFNLEEQLRLLAWVFGTCIIFSFVFGLLGIGTAVDADLNVPGWYGVFIQKNVLGRTMVLSMLVFLFWKRVAPEYRTMARLGLFASLALVVLSRSMTSVVTFVLVTILVLYMRWALKQSVRRAVVAMACLFVVGVAAIRYVISHLVQVTGLLDRSPTLTGRVQLWILSCVAALRRPWLGYGYEAFWLPDTAFVQRIWHVMNWNAPSAHNGFIELWLELGIIGTLLFLLGFAYYLVCALRLVHSHSEPAVWCLAYLMFLFCIDLTEPIFFGANSIFFILYVTVAISLHKESEESRAATPFAVTQGDYA